VQSCGAGGDAREEQQMPDETQLIQKIARALRSFIGTKGRAVGVPLGIGDDAMVMRGVGGKDCVVTVDAFIEGMHFWADLHPADSVGYKALARATSDLAAMGARPKYFLLTLALPKARTGAWLDRMLGGMGKAARALGLTLVGGDTTQASAVSISITVVGEIARGRALTRAGAKPGDILYVSGALGRAQLGLELVRRGLGRDRRLRTLLLPHLYPRIRVELGSWLAAHEAASAMMDLSDGLSSDLARLCASSRVGARIYAERIPCVEIPARIAGRLGREAADPLNMALHGGDDYELMFTVPKRLVGKLKGALGFRNLTAIGEIRRGSSVELVEADGRSRPLRALGWDPFRER
jgi:thiamine-monophosphate kinase